jgi:hypothetical protein
MDLQGQHSVVFSQPVDGVDLTRLRRAAAALCSTDHAPQQTSQGPQPPLAGMPVPGDPHEAQAQRGAVPPAGAGDAGGDVQEPLLPGEEQLTSSAAPGHQLHAARAVSLAGEPGGSLPALPQLLLLLRASFQLVPDLSQPELSLQVPSGLSDLGLGRASAQRIPVPLLPTLQLPLWTPSMCLAEFLPMASERLQSQVRDRRACEGLRDLQRNTGPGCTPLVSAMTEGAPLCGQVDAHASMLEARRQIFQELSALLGHALEINWAAGSALWPLTWEGAQVLASCTLGARFPAEPPTLLLQCVRCAGALWGRGWSGGQAARAGLPRVWLLKSAMWLWWRMRRLLGAPDASKLYNDFPWSPRWPPHEAAHRLHAFLLAELPSFLRTRPA